MFVNNILAANPFIDAFVASDWMGKLIFLGLIILSIVSWILILYKGWITRLARQNSLLFYRSFESERTNPLGFEGGNGLRQKQPNPFYTLYVVLKRHTLEVLNKNRHFGQKQEAYMSPTDVDFVQSHLMIAVTNQVKYLEKNLFILSTIVSLAPFLGLLGTVWGILTTFSDLQTHTGGTHQVVLGGISLALATTVLGLVDAIPALIGYNYLKNNVRDFQVEMEEFSNELLASIEMYYRKVDVS